VYWSEERSWRDLAPGGVVEEGGQSGRLDGAERGSEAKAAESRGYLLADARLRGDGLVTGVPAAELEKLLGHEEVCEVAHVGSPFRAASFVWRTRSIARRTFAPYRHVLLNSHGQPSIRSFRFGDVG
jgi:hypothetical protein